jgi:hypothetical protein
MVCAPYHATIVLACMLVLIKLLDEPYILFSPATASRIPEGLIRRLQPSELGQP